MEKLLTEKEGKNSSTTRDEQQHPLGEGKESLRDPERIRDMGGHYLDKSGNNGKECVKAEK